MIIEIKGVGFENKGAYLMLCAIVKQLQIEFPSAQIALSLGTRSDFLQRCSFTAWQKLALRKNYVDLNFISYWLPKVIRKWLRSWGFITEADIDVILDASGFSYSDQWPSKIRIYHLENELKRFSKYGKPYIFMPQAFGPFSNLASIKRIASSFPYAAMINAREQYSYKNLHQIVGDQLNLHQHGDFTNLVEGIPPNSDILTNYACIIPNKNMISHRNPDQSWIQSYESTLIQAIYHYRIHGLTPIFLNHEGLADAQLIAMVNSKLEDPIAVVEESDPLVIKGIIASATAVFCSRYHGCVSALSSGIPCVGTSWSHKYEALYEDYGMSKFLLGSDVDQSHLQRVIDDSLSLTDQTKKELLEKVEIQKRDSLLMWEEIIFLVNNYYENIAQ
jgi:polysaccharide pyruvyl transferase WcaK-like protein